MFGAWLKQSVQQIYGIALLMIDGFSVNKTNNSERQEKMTRNVFFASFHGELGYV